MQSNSDIDGENDAAMQHVDDTEEDEDEDHDEVSSGASNIRVGKSPSPKGYVYEDDDVDGNDTVVISEQEYERSSPRRMKIISPTTEHFSRGVSTEELRAEGWDDDHITLVQKIAMRGFEPLMPRHYKFEYGFMPDSLFAEDDDAFISSVRDDHRRGSMALEKLFDLGGWVRDRVFLKGRIKPEQQVRKMLKAFVQWAEKDSGLNLKTAIPLLEMEMKPADTDANILQENARRKLASLAARYREAFRILQSIESSPGSRTSTQLSYPIPTLYAIVASHTLIALVAYNPEDAEPDVKSVAFFDMKDKDYDVWNALALAIIVCHCRNVQVRIAEETGLGMRHPGDEEEKVKSDDPDA